MDLQENHDNSCQLKVRLPRKSAFAKPSIFNYLNYREYLKEFYKFKKSDQERYSYAVFSLRAGIKSPNYLKLVIEGTRNVTSDNVLRFAKALALDDLETVYWENLVSFNQAKDNDQRRYYLVKLTHSPLPGGSGDGQKIREIRDEWDYYSAWHHVVIRELVLLPAFSEDPASIAQMLKSRITPEQAKASIELLQRLGFLVRDGAGRLTQAEREVRYFNKEDLQNLVVRNFHCSTAKLALDSLENDPVHDRDFSALTIAISRDALPRFKSQIAEFRKKMNQEFSRLQEADLVLQVNFQVIPVGKSPKRSIEEKVK